MEVVEVVVIGAGQAGLSAAHHLKRLGVEPFVVLDANDAAGGAWQHRWDSLTMHDVHGVADLPGMPLGEVSPEARANVVVPDYFARYEQAFALPILRPVRVKAVTPVDHEPDGLLRVETTRGTWLTKALVNATGTWDTPFRPYYPGIETFRGSQPHTVDYTGSDEFAGRRVIVVGGGASAVQILGELAQVAQTTWVTRTEPIWRTDQFDTTAGREAVALVEERVANGLPPRSVVSVTGIILRPQEQEAAEVGAYERRPMFARIEPDGVRWADGSFEQADVILWATGFRPSVGHLAPLRLRTRHGGIRLKAPFDRHTYTTSTADSRIHFVGYGPSASTIGANRAGRAAARAVTGQLEASLRGAAA